MSGCFPLVAKPAVSPLPPLWEGKCFMRRSMPMPEFAKKDPKTTWFFKIIKAESLITAGISFFIIESKLVKRV
jgi:hypothetical protein